VIPILVEIEALGETVQTPGNCRKTEQLIEKNEY
jgi:hypothetical protein